MRISNQWKPDISNDSYDATMTHRHRSLGLYILQMYKDRKCRETFTTPYTGVTGLKVTSNF